MIKSEFAAAYAERRGRDPKEASKDVQAFLDQLAASLAAGERITFKRFLTISTRQQDARASRSFGVETHQPAQMVVKVKIGTGLRAAVQPLLHKGQEAA